MARNTRRNGFNLAESTNRNSKSATRARTHPVVGEGTPVKWYRIDGGIRPLPKKYRFHPT
jgi:hypothetical protein